MKELFITGSKDMANLEKDRKNTKIMIND